MDGASPEIGFELPTFPELELAIDRLFDVWLKYGEIFYGSSFSRIRNFSRHIQIQTFEALVGDWTETQFDPDADD